MKKILFALLMVAFTASCAYAEIGAQTYSPNTTQNYREQQVFSDFVNNSGSDIASNFVVALDTTNSASGTTLGTQIATTTTSYSTLVVGVTDAAIANGSVGRVCVRGPHKCYLIRPPVAVGATLATTNVAGAAIPFTGNVSWPGGTWGTAISTTTTNPDSGDANATQRYYWVYIGSPASD